MWIAFIGWFLESAARGRFRNWCSTMSWPVIKCTGNEWQYAHSCRHYFATSGGRSHFGGRSPSFVVKRSDVSSACWQYITSRESHFRLADHDSHPSDDTSRADETVRPDAELSTALEEMDRDGLINFRDDRWANSGHLSREDVVGYLRTLRELGV